MKLLQSGCRALALLAVATLLGGCGMQAAPIAPHMPFASGGAEGRRWAVSPDDWKGNLLYVGGDQKTYIFKYPGGKLLGTIASGSFGMCSDARGDVFATRVGEIFEFTHGGTSPIRVYKAPGTVYSCAVDPTTQNFAAVVFCLSGCGDSIAVYRQNLQAPTQVYRDAKLRSMLYCGYDDAGNLYVDGYDKHGRFMISELTSGSQRFKNIHFSDNVAAAGQIQWDGTYLTLETRVQPQIYRLKISGSKGKIAGSIRLTGVGGRASQSWIQGKQVIVPTGPGNKRPKVVGIWKYPLGGREIGRFGGFIPRERMIDGLTISVTPGG
jgi:hypothetical protein